MSFSFTSDRRTQGCHEAGEMSSPDPGDSPHRESAGRDRIAAARGWECSRTEGSHAVDSTRAGLGPRVSVRKVESPLGRWNKADPARPARSTPITALTITVTSPETPPSATRQSQCLTALPGP